MADKQVAPGAVVQTRVSEIECDFVMGPLRYITQSSHKNAKTCVTAVWRNEVGTASFTAPQPS